MELAPLSEIRKLVAEQGWVIRWTGVLSSGDFCVGLLRDGERMQCMADPFSWQASVRPTRTLPFLDADPGQQPTPDYSPPDQTNLAPSRRAAVFGVNIGGHCELGACKKYTGVAGCTMSYDIETAMDESRPGGFALLNSDILSVAALCSCGLEFYVARGEGLSSASQVSKFIRHVVEHQPLWLIGWNCYGFDNECMRYHCEPEIQHLFVVTRTGMFGKPSYGSLLNIPHSYNVDALLYMAKSGYAMPSFKLGDVAESMNTTRKMDMPAMNINTDAASLRRYNMNDCAVTLGVWAKSKMETTIPSIALCTSSPIYDCCRYVTGTLASLGYASYAAARGYLVEWSKCSLPQDYTGGYVMDPHRGLHQNIVVCDFKSMYPTIMASCNINPHSFITSCEPNGPPAIDVLVKENTTTVYSGPKAAVFDSSSQSVMSGFMTYLIDERGRNKKSSPMYALSLKVFANSVYGSLGYRNSSLYSPTCAAAVTAIGRHCVKLAESFFVSEGLRVVYGDTDSCMVTGPGRRHDVVNAVNSALGKMHRQMATSSLRRMSMEIEEVYSQGIFLEKKRYCMQLSDGTLKKAGISLSRRDVSGLCKEAAETTISALFMDERQDTINAISSFVFAVSAMAAENSFTLLDVSRYTKRDGVSCYAIPSVAGPTEYIQESQADLSSVVQCSMPRVLDAVREEIERYTVPCRMGTVAQIVRQSTAGAF